MVLIDKNIELRDKTMFLIKELNLLLEKGFDFKEVKKEENSGDFYIVSVLNKVYSLNVSLENSLMCNDVHLSVYLFRYFYELYIKSSYVFSKSELLEKRLNQFFNNTNWSLESLVVDLEKTTKKPHLIEGYKEKYKKMSRMAHPNIDSFNLHLDSTDDEIFDFVFLNIAFAIYYEVETILIFMSNNNINLNKNVDKNKLIILRNEVIKK